MAEYIRARILPRPRDVLCSDAALGLLLSLGLLVVGNRIFASSELSSRDCRLLLLPQFAHITRARTWPPAQEQLEQGRTPNDS